MLRVAQNRAFLHNHELLGLESFTSRLLGYKTVPAPYIGTRARTTLSRNSP